MLVEQQIAERRERAQSAVVRVEARPGQPDKFRVGQPMSVTLAKAAPK